MDREKLNRLVRTYLSPQELKDLWRKHPHTKGEPPRVVLYDDIIKAPSIEALFQGDNKLIIFYPMSQQGNTTSGHYVALTKDDKKNVIYFYDSYGGMPDVGQKKYANGNLYQEQNNTLIRHLLNSGYDVDYSPYKHQADGDIATCGRHSLNRTHFSELSNDEYNQLMNEAKKAVNNKHSLDEIVSMTFN